MSLPDAWIDRIFNRLTAVYGSRFANQWAGERLGMAREAWSDELRRFAQDWNALQYALDHLPASHPPTAMEFRDLAQAGKRPPSVSREEVGPRPSPEAVQALLGPIRAFGRPLDRHAWARRILAKEAAGDRTLTLTQKRMAHEALGFSLTEPQTTYESTP